MTQYTLSGNAGQVALDKDYVLYPRGLQGTVSVDAERDARALGSDGLEDALKDAGLQPGRTIQLPPVSTGTRALGAVVAPEPASVSLDVPVGGSQGCVLLVEDLATGALQWVLPDDADSRAAEDTRALPALATTQRFTILLGTSAPAAGARGFPSLADLGKKIKSFFFDFTDALLGPIIHGFAKKWETRNRPSFTRLFGPADYRTDDPAFPRLAEADWRMLAQGPALLFVHGTFSTSGAFGAMEPSTMAELSRRYGGRTFAFNHPTMTADPRENAIAFLSDIPADHTLEIDIVCHSRGGLVARQIAGLGQAMGNVKVRNIVFVGATNSGTALADDDHMVEMISRFTTIAKFIPAGSARAIVDALVLVVKVLGHGLLHDLEGLRAMNPRGPFLQALNVVPEGSSEPPGYFAIASDFEPKAGSPWISMRRAEDFAADQIFEAAANDLVVPQDGVFAKNGAAGFPIGDARCLRFGPADGVIHTEFFVEPRTQAMLLEWLGGGNQGLRALPGGPMPGGATPADVARLFDTMRDRVMAELAPQRGLRALDAKDAPFTPAELAALAPHVVNLSEGVFKQSGIFSSTPADVDTMIHEHIPKWAADNLSADAPLRVVVWAHGGLIGEKDGLRIAQKHIEWWKKNGVYPIYIVWETGLFDALRSILEAVRRRLPGGGGRDLFDFTSDPLVELGARALGGVQIWGAMKRNAELANAASGGATYLADRLKDLVGNGVQGRPIEFHAVGHSAGSIFHSWFVPMANAHGVPQFKTLQLLAPAITVAEFQARLAAQIGIGLPARNAIVYTMKKQFEEDDDCMRVYRKSLLYLIHHALEKQSREPVLGLEISLRADVPSATLFGLNGAKNAPGRVVWSVTDQADGPSASRSTSHGGFDDDAATMNAVAANVIDAAKAKVPYTGATASRGLDGWPVSDDWLAGVDVSSSFAASPLPADRQPPGSTGHGKPDAAGMAVTAKPKPKPKPNAPAGQAGKRRALCIGIDDYPAPNTLSGCVNDTVAWQKTLEKLDFDVTRLIDKQATHRAIVQALGELLAGSEPGDVLVLQYSGHGTQVPDLDGDEEDGTDEAFVPIDFTAGAFLIDDDIRAVFQGLPMGVNLTCFIDCCHSGTITRMLGNNADLDDQTHARFLKHTGDWDDWIRAHERFRQRERSVPVATSRGQRGQRGARAVDANMIRWVNFSACDATEVAYESQGSGDFTRQATALLAAGTQRTNREFQDAVIDAFGTRRRQTPQLDCADDSRDLTLLLPLG